jgi:hypothetical protein
MVKKKTEKVVEIPQEELINGAFIRAYPIKKNDLQKQIWIKLNSINIIEEYNEHCIFWTYKDCRYFVELSAYELRKAVNSFLFEPESHYTNYI